MIWEEQLLQLPLFIQYDTPVGEKYPIYHENAIKRVMSVNQLNRI